MAVDDTNVESSKIVSRSIRIWTSLLPGSVNVDRSPTFVTVKA